MTPSDRINPTIFVIADDQLLLDSLEILLDVLGFAVRSFIGVDQFLSFYRPQMPGCLLLECHTTGGERDDLLRQSRNCGFRLATIVAVDGDAESALAIRELHPDIDLLIRPYDRDTLVDHVNKALALDAAWRQRDAECVALEERIRRLGKRDRETLRMIQAGEPNKTMAAKFSLTESAAKMRRSALLRKLQVRSVAELTDLTAGTQLEAAPVGSADKR
jgi:FixJ family two-component response regulator